MSTETHIKDAIEAGKKIRELELAAHVHTHGDGKPFLVIPSGMSLTDFESYLPKPMRRRATVVLDDAASFVAYVNRFKSPASVVFGDLTGRAFEAVLDYHEEGAVGAASWATHRALLTCETTSHWDTWDEADGRSMNQTDFARFIEENIPNIVDPPGGKLLEICTTLEATKSVNMRSSVRLPNGQVQFKYEETIEGSAGSQAGQVAVPEIFRLAIEPFQGVGLAAIDARLRYRIGGGSLALSYELVRPDDVLDAAFADLVTLIKNGVGDVPVYAGAAPNSVKKAAADRTSK